MASENASQTPNNDTSSAASPEAQASDSNGGGGTNSKGPKFVVHKDRACPFCGQKFTSSSLGRHLDLYIRDKNPKAPDGVHDVAEIRKMRSTITRRHARGSSISGPAKMRQRSPQAEEGSGGRSNGRSEHDGVDPNDAPSYHPPLLRHLATPTTKVPLPSYKIDWRATGVINDLPPRGSASRSVPQLDSHATSPGARPPAETQHSRRAIELALKDVLRSVHAATAAVSKPPMFDFNFYEMNFPALCLRLLPPPATLFSSTPVWTGGCWPKEPPGSAQRDLLAREIADRVANDVDTPRDADAHAEPANGVADAPRLHRRPSDSGARGFLDHVSDVFGHWETLASARRAEIWQLELQRAVAAEQQKRREAEQRLDRVQVELDLLKANLDSVKEASASASSSSSPDAWRRGTYAHATWPSSAPVHTSSSPGSHHHHPRPAALRPDAARELARAHGSGDRGEWDFDRLVGKWEAFARSGGGGGGGGAPPSLPRTNSLPPLSANNTSQPAHPPQAQAQAQTQSNLTAEPAELSPSMAQDKPEVRAIELARQRVASRMGVGGGGSSFADGAGVGAGCGGLGPGGAGSGAGAGGAGSGSSSPFAPPPAKRRALERDVERRRSGETYRD